MRYDNQAQWNAIFGRPDPWSYEDLYERTKRAHTLEALPTHRFRRVLEVGCAEGHLTEALSPLATQVVAVDISTVALARAAARCEPLGNVAFEARDAFRELPDGGFDLVVCTEVLYYAQNRFALSSILRRLVSRLDSDGYLLLEHATSVADERDRTGFDFHEIGAAFIGSMAARIAGLRFVRELRTELYRVQLFQKETSRATRQRGPDEVWSRKAAVGPDDKVVGLIKWDGCRVTEAEAMHQWCSPEIAILMYHRIADDGPDGLAPYRVTVSDFERQLAFLQKSGYHSVSVEEICTGVLAPDGKPRPGRWVAFTFDDAYKDFFESAWPLLRKYGFTATVFVPASLVGGHAEWDSMYGTPAPLMSWDEIRTVQRQGVSIGSHSMSHPQLTTLTEEECRSEMSKSRASIEAQVGVAPVGFSYPFEDVNDAVRGIARECGYSYAVAGAGLAGAQVDPFLLPRQEVMGSTDMDAFSRLLATPQPATWRHRLRYGWRHFVRDRRTYMDF